MQAESNSVWLVGDAGLERQEINIGTLDKGYGGPRMPGWRFIREALRTVEEQFKQCFKLIW